MFEGFAPDEEVLMPFVPDLDDSSEEDRPSIRAPVTPVADPRKMAEEALTLMKTLYLHNHHERDLFKNSAFMDSLKGQVCSNSKPIPVISRKDTTYPEFVERFVKNGGHPVVIRGIPEEEGWAAADKWSSAENLLHHHGNVPIKVFDIPPLTGMGKPYEIRLPLSAYKEYAETNPADSPFYGFEYDFSDAREALLGDYKIPDFFLDDFYNTSERIRTFYPNNKHLIIGGPRTGTNLHFDPKGTCAWNTCLLGRKKWGLFPPGTDCDHLERIRSKTCGSGTAIGGPPGYWWLDDAPHIGAEAGMIEFIQEAGDTVFVPSGWWHCVVNIEFNICMTHNLLIPELLPAAWPQIKRDWPRFSKLVEKHSPQILISNGIEVVQADDSPEEEEEDLEFYSVHRQ